MRKSSKGITLIALIITIIVLLILAGVTIAQLTESGLFEKARLSKEQQENAEIKEEVTLSEYKNTIGEYIHGNRDSNVDYSEYDDILELLYTNAGEFNLPTTLEDLIDDGAVFSWVLNSTKNVDYIVENPNTFRNLIINNKNAMECIGSNEYAGDKMIQNKEWREAILESDYLEDFNIGATTVPIMTSNTTPEGEAFISYLGDSPEPFTCFDGDDTSAAYIGRPNTLNGYIGYKFSEKVTPYYVAILNYYDYSNYFSNIKIQGLNENDEWIDLTDVVNINYSGWSYIKLKTNEAYSKYQSLRVLQTTDKGSAYYAGAYTIQFYCR